MWSSKSTPATARQFRLGPAAALPCCAATKQSSMAWATPTAAGGLTMRAAPLSEWAARMQDFELRRARRVRAPVPAGRRSASRLVFRLHAENLQHRKIAQIVLVALAHARLRFTRGKSRLVIQATRPWSCQVSMARVYGWDRLATPWRARGCRSSGMKAVDAVDIVHGNSQAAARPSRRPAGGCRRRATAFRRGATSPGRAAGRATRKPAIRRGC